MKSIVVLLGSLALSVQAIAQTSVPGDPAKNTLHVEAFGQGFCWSLNYDRLFNTNKRIANSFSLGASVVPEWMGFGTGGKYITVPGAYHWLFGKRAHHLELGMGFTYMNLQQHGVSTNYFYTSPKIAYRFQRPQGGVFCKISANGMIDVLHTSMRKYGSVQHVGTLSDIGGSDLGCFIWPGISLGYTFR